MSDINFDDLLGRKFYFPLDENGKRKRGNISDHVNTINQDQASREDQLRLKLRVDWDQRMILQPTYGIPRRQYRYWKS